MTSKPNPASGQAGTTAPTLPWAQSGLPDYDERATMGAWEMLLSGEPPQAPQACQVRTVINDSWNRCARCGLDAMASEAPIDESGDAIEGLSRSNAELLDAARRSFGSIGSLLEGTGAMMVLADQDGVLIQAIGDRRTLFDGRDIHLAVGGKWTEDAIGTNGIGTALHAGAPVFVHAAEHFVAGIKGWTCAGAPIRDPLDGRIVGVVDLSGRPGIFRPHNTALVATVAREIEKALAEAQEAERTRLLEAFIASAPHYKRTDGLMILDRRGRTVYCANVPCEVTERFPLDGLAKADARRAGQSDFLDDLTRALPPAMRGCHLSPLKLDGALRGAALVLPTRSRAASGAGHRDPVEEAAAAIVGDSPALRAVVDVAARVARTREVSSLLIQGETGVGKELFARLVGSARAGKDRFVAVNCGAITRELIGSELFGHVAGAFTGASREGKPGVFELAHEGVLSLDEIGELPLDIQPFLLRVLEERAVQRIGDSRPRPVDVRLVASTNRDLKAEIAAGRFRRDLYYRISTVTIEVPPLRARGDDVLLLLEHFNRTIASRLGGDPLGFAEGARDALRAYRWPGNVRELKSLVERLHLLVRGSRVERSDLPAEIAEPDRVPGPAPAAVPVPGAPASERPHSAESLEEHEREAIRAALQAEQGNLTRVAQRLGISRPTLYRKLNLYGFRRSFG
ncbi:MAG: sigma-54-dependent Fis family transcriptional regulator [Amaricoccus sp.]